MLIILPEVVLHNPSGQLGELYLSSVSHLSASLLQLDRLHCISKLVLVYLMVRTSAYDHRCNHFHVSPNSLACPCSSYSFLDISLSSLYLYLDIWRHFSTSPFSITLVTLSLSLHVRDGLAVIKQGDSY